MNSHAANYLRVEQAIKFLTSNFKSQPSLEEVARQVNLSPFHFQRLFVDWVGISPKKFLQHLTMNHLRERLQQSPNLLDAAETAGLSSQSRVYDLFVTIEGVTPDEYKNAGEGLEICYGYHPSPFGTCFIAASERGVCGLYFVDEERKQNQFDTFKQKWRFAKIVHDPSVGQRYVGMIFGPQRQMQGNIRLLVQGTKFQLNVWEALLRIPFASITTFQQVADSIGRPHAARAVATAVVANPVLYLIPCHRIICKDGSLGEYHWGRVRKQLMIAWELAKEPQESVCETTFDSSTSSEVDSPQYEVEHR